jgi:hypothetical protein
MDLYSVNSAVSVGNEIAKNAYSENQFRLTQNAVSIESANITLTADKSKEAKDVGIKSFTDTISGIEAPLGIATMRAKGLSGLAAESAENIRSTGNAVLNTVKGINPFPDLPKAGDIVSLTAKPALTPAQVGISTADDISKGMADALNTGKLTFSSVAEAGSLNQFILNKTLGMTSKIGLEAGGKALGAIGAGMSAESDISNLVSTGHIFNKGESLSSEVGNVSSMIGFGLDMASIALPVLAPFALAANVLSGVTGTVGAIQDDKSQIATDSKPPQENTLSIHPAWAAVGMVASVHNTPSIS